MKNVNEIVAAYLIKNGYDGLYNKDGGCGCILGMLAPCASYSMQCLPGYRTECDCGEDCRFHVGPKGPDPKRKK